MEITAKRGAILAPTVVLFLAMTASTGRADAVSLPSSLGWAAGVPNSPVATAVSDASWVADVAVMLPSGSPGSAVVQYALKAPDRAKVVVLARTTGSTGAAFENRAGLVLVARGNAMGIYDPFARRWHCWQADRPPPMPDEGEIVPGFYPYVAIYLSDAWQLAQFPSFPSADDTVAEDQLQGHKCLRIERKLEKALSALPPHTIHAIKLWRALPERYPLRLELWDTERAWAVTEYGDLVEGPPGTGKLPRLATTHVQAGTVKRWTRFTVGPGRRMSWNTEGFRVEETPTREVRASRDVPIPEHTVRQEYGWIENRIFLCTHMQITGPDGVLWFDYRAHDFQLNQGLTDEQFLIGSGLGGRDPWEGYPLP